MTQSQTLSESTTAPELLVLDNLLQFIEYHVDAVKSKLVSSLARDLTIAYHLGGKKAGKEIGVSGPLGLQGLEPIYARLGPILDKTFGSMGAELTNIIKAGLKNGSSYATVQKQLADKIRSGWGHYITFDNTGESRKVVRVSPSGKLSFVDATVTRPVTLSAETYADTLGRTAMKQAYAAGHFQRYQENGYKGWVYLSVCDERTRPWHLALHGRVFLFGSPEEAMAKQVMSEYNCRCRPAAWFDNASIDTPPSTYAAERKDWAEQALTENPTPPNAEYLQQVIQHSEAVKEAFDPSEPRDDQGKWTGDGSSFLPGHIAKFKKDYGTEKTEHLRAIKEGNVVEETHGTHTHTDFPKRENAKDADILHNHPRNCAALSPSDIYHTMLNNSKSITAVTKSRGSWTLTRPAEGWPKIAQLSVKWAFEDAGREESKPERIGPLLARVRSKEISMAEGDRINTENIARNAIGRLGLSSSLKEEK